jgi:peptide-methionine (S)-S-oxide reductase
MRFATSAAAALLAAFFGTSGHAAPLPAPAVDATRASTPGTQTAVFAGGCFWGVEAVYRHMKGVQSAVSGYAGGRTKNPTYMEVVSGATGHAESVEVTYDPSQVTYGELLRVFMSVAHDPTELNRQGPDVGTQYRSAIYFVNDEQKKIAQAYVAQLDAAKVFKKKIVTELAPLTVFYPAEPYHQDYVARNPMQPYIVFNDLPKLEALKKEFPSLVRAQPLRGAAKSG